MQEKLQLDIRDFWTWIGNYFVFHGRVTLFFANKFSTECRITMEFLHNYF